MNQTDRLHAIFDQSLMSPVFMENPKYCVSEFEGMIPYISFNDIIWKHFTIRARPTAVYDRFDTEDREIIVRYNSIEELVNDGWRLNFVSNLIAQFAIFVRNNFITQSFKNLTNTATK